MTSHRRRLPGTYGLLTIAESTDQTAAAVTYRVRAPHVTGTFVAVPTWTGGQRERQALPDGVELRFGTGSEYTHGHQREDRPTIYGVSLVGAMNTDPLDFLLQPDPWYRFSRPTGPYTSRSVPDRTNALALAVVTQLLILWTVRPDRAELVRTRARRSAPARLNQLTKGPIAATVERIEALQQELTRHRTLAAELETLAAEHEAVKEHSPS